jgi:hypothetical protein
MKYSIPFLIFSISLLLSACNREGCTDIYAANYKEKAETDDGTCRYDSDPFEGRWEIRDSLNVFGDWVAQPIKVLDVRIQSTNRSKVKFFWRYENGTYSDTLEANAKPNTLSIPAQPFQDSLTIQGNFTIARIGGIKCDYRYSGVAVYSEFHGVGTEID